MKKLALALLVIVVAPNFGSAQQQYYDVTPGNGNGLRFWQTDAYKIHMGTGSEYFFGPVTDYSIKMNMDNSTNGRGWTWGRSGITPVAALNVLGNMQIAGSFTTGGDIILPSVNGNKQIYTWSPSDANWRIGMSQTPGFTTSMATSHVQYLTYFTGPGQGFAVGVNGGQSSFEITGSNHNAFFRGNVGIGIASPPSRLSVIIPVSTSSTGGDPNAYGAYFTDNSSSTMAIRSLGNGAMHLATDGGGRKLILGGGVFEQTLSVNSGGNVGIGTTSPSDKLSVSGGAITLDADQPLRGGGKWLISGNSSQVTVGTANPGVNLRFDAGAGGRMFVDGTSGNVGIGTTNPGSYKLAVEGKIGAREVNVIATNPWPDYVFEKNYTLPTLESIQTYIDQNKHLPEVPSAKEIEKNGVNLGEMNALLLKKIEELTLYTIEMNKKLEELKKENESAKEQMKNMQSEINQLKK